MSIASIAGPLVSAGLSFWGGNEDRKAQNALAEKNIALQREFAQNGIQWKVQDAQKAGVHPLYALGANTVSYSPVSVGSSMGSTMSSVGQDISRAITATASADTRGNAAQQMMTALGLKRAQLENDLLASQIQKMNAPGTPPPIPTDGGKHQLIDGQGNSVGPTNDKPMERTIMSATNPHSEPAELGHTGWARSATGWYKVPSKDVKERIEDIMPLEWLWFAKNYLPDNLSVKPYDPPPWKPAQGTSWWYNSALQEYQNVTLPKRHVSNRSLRGNRKTQYKSGGHF